MTTETTPAPARDAVVGSSKAKKPESPTFKTKDGALTLPRPTFEKPTKVYRTKLYWIGVTEDCPITNITIAGVAFQKWTGSSDTDIDGKPTGTRIMGGEVELTGSQVDDIAQLVMTKFIRPLGSKDGRIRGLLMSSGLRYNGPGTEPSSGSRMKPTDRPVGEFLYMIEMKGQAKPTAPKTIMPRE